MKKDMFWKNKNIFITGVAGFVGSNLAKNLIKNGANVVGLTQNKKKHSLLYYEKIDKKIDLIFGDITDIVLLNNIFQKYNIEICFHLAAQVEVGLAAKNPYSTWETNIRGTYTLLEAIRKNKKKIKSIIIASSDKAYGDYPAKNLPYKESYELKANFPYDTSKACADIIAKSYSSKLYKLPIVITRFANIYGPGQLNFTAIIPDAIRSCLLNKNFLMRSDGEAVRDFVYIDDIIKVYKLLSKNLYLNPKKFKGEVFNAGTNIKHKIKDIVKMIFIHTKKQNELKKIYRKIKNNKLRGELSIQLMDYEKLNNYLGWKPKYNFSDVLPGLIKWYQKYLNKF
jgi:CDP-glucose 4,6-dehydratase